MPFIWYEDNIIYLKIKGRYIKKEDLLFFNEKKDLLIIAPSESKIINNLRLCKDKFNVDKV